MAEGFQSQDPRSPGEVSTCSKESFKRCVASTSESFTKPWTNGAFFKDSRHFSPVVNQETARYEAYMITEMFVLTLR